MKRAMCNLTWLVFLASFVVALPVNVNAQDVCKEGVKKASKIFSLLEKKSFLQEVLKSCKNDPEVNYQYAYTLERLRHYKKAEIYYRKAVELDSKNSKYLFGLGDVLRVLGRDTEALNIYRKGLKLDPENKRVKKYVQDLENTVPKEAPKPVIAKKPTPKQGEKSIIKEEPTPQKVAPAPKKKVSITLKFEEPQRTPKGHARLLERIIASDRTDKILGAKVKKEFLRRKAQDEAYFATKKY